MSYTVSIEDIKAYLASLAPDEPCGESQRPRACLVEQALEHKYPGAKFHVNNEDFYSLSGSGTYGLAEDVQSVVKAFDNSAMLYPTREQVEQDIPQLRGDH